MVYVNYTSIRKNYFKDSPQVTSSKNSIWTTSPLRQGYVRLRFNFYKSTFNMDQILKATCLSVRPSNAPPPQPHHEVPACKNPVYFSPATETPNVDPRALAGPSDSLEIE